MVQIPSFLHSTFKELSNEYSHAQIRVKTKKLWPRQVREKKTSCCPENMSRPGNGVATRKFGRDQEIVSRPKNLCRDQEIVSRPENLIATKNAAET